MGCSLRCSAQGCHDCKGVLRPEEPDYDLSRKPWNCSVCDNSISFEEVEKLEECIEDSINAAAGQAQPTEQVLEKFNSFLPARHYARFQLTAQLAELLLRPQERL